jgi:hypothetical protein
MLTMEARIETDRPGRYLRQLCKHAASMGGARGHGARVHLRRMLARDEVQVHAEWSDTHGVVTFDPWGLCTIQAVANALTLRIEAADEESLLRIQDIVTRNLDRFGRRDRLTVEWQQPAAPSVSPDADPAP